MLSAASQVRIHKEGGKLCLTTTDSIHLTLNQLRYRITRAGVILVRSRPEGIFLLLARSLTYLAGMCRSCLRPDLQAAAVVQVVTSRRRPAPAFQWRRQTFPTSQVA